jgi:hypothetical protein
MLVTAAGWRLITAGATGFAYLGTSSAELTHACEVMPYKLSSPEVVLTPVSGQLVNPDARWIAGAAGLANLLLAGWIRAARRTRRTRRTRRRRPRR